MSCSDCPSSCCVASGTVIVAPGASTRVNNPSIEAGDEVSYGLIGWAAMGAAENGLVTVVVGPGYAIFSSTFPAATVSLSYSIVRSS